MPPMVFKFNNLVRLEVYSDDARVRDFYLKEYRHHLSNEEISNLSVVKLHLNKKIPGRLENVIKYHHKIIARWC